jgi:hypothetical protein
MPRASGPASVNPTPASANLMSFQAERETIYMAGWKETGRAASAGWQARPKCMDSRFSSHLGSLVQVALLHCRHRTVLGFFRQPRFLRSFLALHAHLWCSGSGVEIRRVGGKRIKVQASKGPKRGSPQVEFHLRLARDNLLGSDPPPPAHRE